MELSKGQKIPLNENFLTLKFERPDSVLEIDTAAFLTGGSGKVSGDEDFVFYGNRRHKSGSVTHDNDTIKIDLSRVPRDVERISVTATIYEAAKRRQNFSLIRDARLKIFCTDGEIATFPLENFTVETAIVLGEVYRYKGNWKFNATGAGFKGGLAALCKNFGIEVNDAPAPSNNPQHGSSEKKSTREIEPERPKIDTSRRHSKGINMGPNSSEIDKGRSSDVDVFRENSRPKKIELRRGQKVTLVKRGVTLGEIVINLTWQQRQSKIFDGDKNRGIDLELACLFDLKDDTIGVVQALGNYFGRMNYPPYISLDDNGQKISGAKGETIRINGRFADKIRRILIYTFIYQGAANWQEARGVVTVNCPGSPELIVRMDEYNSRKYTCALVMLENVGGTFSVEKVVEFFDDAEKMDYAFDWGLSWTASGDC